MRIVTRTRLLKFGALHPPAVGPLRAWEVAVKNAAWSCSNDVKQTFRNADWVNSLWVFDVSRYRIIADVRYQFTLPSGTQIPAVLYIKSVLTHPEYDSWSASKAGKAKR